MEEKTALVVLHHMPAFISFVEESVAAVGNDKGMQITHEIAKNILCTPRG